MKKIRTLEDNNFFKTWLIRILINECNDILNKNKRTILLEEEINKVEYTDVYEDIDLTRSINLLNENLRIVTVLFYFEDMATKDIAKILEIPEGTVRSRLSRVRQQLRVIIEEVYLNEDI